MKSSLTWIHHWLTYGDGISHDGDLGYIQDDTGRVLETVNEDFNVAICREVASFIEERQQANVVPLGHQIFG